MSCDEYRKLTDITIFLLANYSIVLWTVFLLKENLFTNAKNIIIIIKLNLTVVHKQWAKLAI